MIDHRFRIIISLIIAFLVINLYGRLSTGPLISPIQTENVKNLLANLKFPTVNLRKIFTLHSNPDEGKINQSNQNVEFFILIPSQPFPTKSVRNGLLTQPTQTIFNLKPKPTKTLTQKPKPTKVPKPTVTLQPITTNIRPGTTLGEIFQEIEKRTCVPAALLRAFQENETGAWIPYNTPASIIKKYNSFGWWKDKKIDPCFAFGYDLKTGIVPKDSAQTGTKCPIYISSANSGIMGIFAVDQYEQDGVKKYIANILPNNLDRRVIFDNALIFAIITKNRVVEPKNCKENWPDDIVRLAAKKHLGACIVPENGHNYCDEVLTLYKKYR